MTIDETIAHERRLTAGYRNDIQILKNVGADILSITSVTKQMEYHEQLAEWLEELKDHRERECNHINEALYDKCYLEGYNKAIDDFADKIISLCDDGEFMNRFNDFPATTILEVAEQLKAGREDGNNE